MRQSSAPIAVPSLSLPKGGGGVRGLGQTFQSNEFTGTMTLSVPIAVSPARNFQPDLSLNYDSGQGNGPLGCGFSLPLAYFTRKTDQGVPDYNDNDTLVFSEVGDLVPRLIKTSDGTWERDQRTVTQDGVTWHIQVYVPQQESTFVGIELWIDQTASQSYWKVISGDNVTGYYGLHAQSRIVDPDHHSHIFQWLLEITIDSLGNKIEYYYKREDLVGVTQTLSEINRSSRAALYIERIAYGNFLFTGPAGIQEERFAFEIVFDYGGYDLTQPNQAPGPWTVRQDPFSTYKAGFEIRLYRLCRAILVFHRFSDKRELVRATRLDYSESATISCVRSIEQIGFQRDEAGVYHQRSLPLFTFGYTTFNPLDSSYQPLHIENSSRMLPGPLEEQPYLFVDLYGEGLPGYIYHNGTSLLYWRPAGGGTYTSASPLPIVPLEGDLAQPEYTLTDLIGDGRLSLTVHQFQRNGYYQANDDGSWQPYQDFDQYPLDTFNRSLLADINGAGQADMLILTQDDIRVYPARGLRGFGPAYQAFVAPDFPVSQDPYEQEMLAFADMFGDGLTHRVRIRDGLVECWPDLGHGRFGKKITLDNAPHFQHGLDRSRLFLADMDGSGTTDLAYVYQDHIDIFLNQSGNRFSNALVLPLPIPYDEFTRITFIDVIGTGATCLVVSHLSPHVEHFYYDFTRGMKPYILNEMRNNLGAVTSVQYASATTFYLEDKRSGRPWATHVPFSVQVVTHIESRDLIAKSCLVSRFKYHDGYYDAVEHEFRGFGFVERWDSETFDQYSAVAEDEPSAHTLTEAEYTPPLYSKSWYHTGAYVQKGVLSRQFASEYYRGDPQAVALPDSIFADAINQSDSETVRQAYVALAGHLLRSEVYGEDGSISAVNPYSVIEANFMVDLLQPRDAPHHAVFFVYTRETLSYDYERQAGDPRVQHQCTLEVDGYGNILRACQVAYPRRRPAADTDDPIQRVYPEQLTLMVTASVSAYINEVQPEYRWIGLEYESRDLEIHGLTLASGTYFSFEQLEAAIDSALLHVIPYGQTFTSGLIQARPYNWQRFFYWSEDQRQATYGQASPRMLLCSIANAISPPAWVEDVFGRYVGPEQLIESGYVLMDGYWWNPGLTMSYYQMPESFYQPFQYTDNFGGETSVVYDTYWLYQTKITELPANGVQKLVRTAEMDYTVLHYKQISDYNGRITQARYDPLGMVLVTTLYQIQSDGQRIGDAPLDSYQVKEATFDDVLASPNMYLQQTSSYTYCDLTAWQTRQQPTVQVNLLRETFVSDVLPGEQTRVRIEIQYIDGFGRVIETKLKAGVHRAVVLSDVQGVFQRDTNLRILRETTSESWVTSGYTIYNNKGLPVREYQPYYSSSPAYEDQAVLLDQDILPAPTISYYDATGRIVRQLTAKGFLLKLIYNPWWQASYDENDTVLDSPYYQQNYRSAPPDEKDALDKAALCYDTPDVALYDSMGRSFCNIQIDVAEVQISAARPFTYLLTRKILDIAGNAIQTLDPRGVSLTQMFDMTQRTLSTISADAGPRWQLLNIFNNTSSAWDNRGVQSIFTYDLLQRAVQTRVIQDGLDAIVARNVYGESQIDAVDRNLRGEIFRSYDQAGVVQYNQYSLQGLINEQMRQLCQDYKATVDWQVPDKVPLEATIFTIHSAYDELGRVTTRLTPDNTRYQPVYDISGLLKQIILDIDEVGVRKQKVIVEDIQYNADAQRTRIAYGVPGLVTQITYEDTTLRPLSIVTTRAGEGPGDVLQDLVYSYDPVGNITRLRDCSEPSVFYKQQKVDDLTDYHYDALYRLRQANGRQHAGIQADTHSSGFKQSLYLSLAPSPHRNDLQSLEHYIEEYQYDLSGNLIEQVHRATSSDSWTRTSRVETASNRLIGQRYDGNGNLLSLEGLRQVIWDYNNTLKQVDHVQRDGGAPSDSDYYRYDISTQRIRKVTERYNNQGMVIDIRETLSIGNYRVYRTRLQSASSSTVILERHALDVRDENDLLFCTLYQWITDLYQRRTTAPGEIKLRYQLTNIIGSSLVEVDENAALVSWEDYFPFGGTSVIAGYNQSEVDLKDYRYTGKECDDSTGLYYYGARYYITWLGRWLSPDPAGASDSLNLYLYAGNNPIKNWDDTGLCKNTGKDGCKKRSLKEEESSGSEGENEARKPTARQRDLEKSKKAKRDKEEEKKSDIREHNAILADEKAKRDKEAQRALKANPPKSGADLVHMDTLAASIHNAYVGNSSENTTVLARFEKGKKTLHVMAQLSRLTNSVNYTSAIDTGGAILPATPRESHIHAEMWILYHTVQGLLPTTFEGYTLVSMGVNKKICPNCAGVLTLAGVSYNGKNVAESSGSNWNSPWYFFNIADPYSGKRKPVKQKKYQPSSIKEDLEKLGSYKPPKGGGGGGGGGGRNWLVA